MLDVVVAFLVAYSLYWFFVLKRHPERFPPGPRLPIPLVGDAFQLFRSRVEAFQELRERYGDIFGFWGTTARVVVVSSFELIQEVGAKEEFSDRPPGIPAVTRETRGGLVQGGGTPGVLFSSGRNWVEQRRYTLHTLRNLGFGKNSMEDLVAEEASDLCDFLEGTGGRPVDIRNEFNMSVLNVLWRIFSNEKLPRDDQRLKELMLLLDSTLQQGSRLVARMVFMYRPLMALNQKLKIFANSQAFSGLRKFSENTLQKHEETFQEESMRDFIDHYLQEIRDRSSRPEPSSFKGEDGRLNLQNIIFDLFIAGSETTSTTLNWGMLYMILNPDAQARVREELDAVTGRGSRMPTSADRARTPYTEAVIHEIQRLGNILSLSVTHFTSSGGTLGGGGRYEIPAGTAVMCNLGAVLRDPRFFPDPDRFDPSRYLHADGDGDGDGGERFVPHPKVIPFGLGKRRCLGEALAKMELYVFFTAILARFELRMAEEEEEEDPAQRPSTDPITGFTLSPKPFRMRFCARS